MKKAQRIRLSSTVILLFTVFAAIDFTARTNFDKRVLAEEVRSAAPTPTPAETPKTFDQAAELTKLRESIKGHGNEPAEKVFKNIQTFKGVPAGRVLAIMEIGYSRSLGVNCTHCHTPEDWAGESKDKKQITRDMASMVGRINGDLLKNIKNLKGAAPTINCTTCHRGQIVPALDLPFSKP